ncbi:MAG: T9SS type A sorting domain-containing protein [Saprospiraceae bacterium]|nr:T9SS type A sorting domain-containing protein [Saprospiraceae bacterium]
MRSLIGAVLFISLLSSSHAQMPDIGLQLVVGGFSDPVDIAHAGDSRLFIVEQGGVIRIIDGGTVLPAPFLDISTIVNSGANERGLLGLAFHPNYSTNGYFFVNYTNSSGHTVVARYSVSANPDIGDSGSALPIITIVQDFNNHNGGDLNFGPDGYLYIGMGDGGDGGDPNNRAQDGLNLLGKMLRIDVDNPSIGSNYGIPAGNPFVGNPAVLDEIWALGLRNPWRFSFDSGTGDMFIADVGQDNWEEIDHQPASSSGGENYGWRCYEGNNTFNTSGCGPIGNYTFPIHAYTSSFPTGCSVTGGYVYRGTTYPKMQGKYIYTDYCTGRFWMLEPDGMGGWTNTFLKDFSNFSYASFGQDVNGELYVTDVSTGSIYQVIDNSVVVPVELISFEAYAKGDDVILEWQTASEVNFDRYEIMRSNDGVTWNKLTSVNGEAFSLQNRIYHWDDINVPSGQWFYRLKIKDLDGSIDFSSIEKVLINDTGYVRPYPNPAKAGQMVQLASDTKSLLNAKAEIISITGKRMANVHIQEGSIEIPEDLPKGYYLLRIAGAKSFPLIISN